MREIIKKIDKNKVGKNIINVLGELYKDTYYDIK